jgi:thiamine-phosphate pyrophosphorylase
LGTRVIRHCIADRNIAPLATEADVIQIRDKELPARQLLKLVTHALTLGPKVIVNERADVAIAARAHGVHLRSHPIPPREWRRIVPEDFLIGVSCHTIQDIQQADGADYVYFSPIFESPGHGPPVGLPALEDAVRAARMPVIALGGITWDNALLCLEAGAAGIAGIRLFHPGRGVESCSRSPDPL